MLALHQDDSFGTPVIGNIRAAGYRDVVERIETGQIGVDDCRFFCGYSGWAPGQLQAEIDAGVWYACAASDGIIMERSTDGTFGEVLRLMGGRFENIAQRMDERHDIGA